MPRTLTSVARPMFYPRARRAPQQIVERDVRQKSGEREGQLPPPKPPALASIEPSPVSSPVPSPQVGSDRVSPVAATLSTMSTIMSVLPKARARDVAVACSAHVAA